MSKNDRSPKSCVYIYIYIYIYVYMSFHRKFHYKPCSIADMFFPDGNNWKCPKMIVALNHIYYIYIYTVYIYVYMYIYTCSIAGTCFQRVTTGGVQKMIVPLNHVYIYISFIYTYIYIYIIDIYSYIYIYMCPYFSIGFLTINHPAIGVPMIHRASPNLILKGPSWKLGGKSQKMADFRGTLW